MQGFSFASVILSYFLVGGGLFAGTLAIGLVKSGSELVLYLLLAAGSLLGGFVAARASRGSSILETAIGAIALVATVVGLAAGTPIGKLFWSLGQDQTVKLVAALGGSCAGGALVGAFLSERLLGEATASSIPWILYTALSTFGACVLAMLFSSLVVLGKDQWSSDQFGKLMLIGMAAGCVLSGLAVGASARTRPLLASLLGGGLGVAGFGLLLLRASGNTSDKDAPAVIAFFAAGGCVVTLLGALAGWVTVGRRHAG